MRRFAFALALVSGLSMANAEVPKEHKSSFTRARSAISSLESGLHTTRKTPSERSIADAEKRLVKVDELLATLPAAEPDVVALAKRRAAVRAEIDRRRAALSGTVADAQAGNAALEAGGDTDLATMEAVRARLADLRKVLGDTPKNDGIELWSQVRNDAQALLAKYKGKRGTTDLARTMEREVRILESEFGSIQRLVLSSGAGLPELATRYIDMADKATQPGKEKANIDAFVGAIRNARRGAALLDKLELIVAAEPTIVASAVPAQRARIAAIEARIGAAKVAVIAKTVMPAERYGGGDKETLRAAIAEHWKSTNPRFPAIKIVLDEAEWSRSTEWRFEHGRWRKLDQSVLHAFVFIKADASTAHFYAAYVLKDHMASDRMTLHLDATSGAPANWEQVIALSKVAP